MRRPELTMHVVYGIPCVGKSTAAFTLAHHHGITTIVSTDYIREVQRKFGPPSEALAKVTHTAWELYGTPSQDNIEAGFNAHVNAVAPAVAAVFDKLVNDGMDAVIEGAHFHGDLIENLRDTHRDVDVRATLLVVESAAQLVRRIDDKERRRANGSAPKRWRENLAILLAIQEYLISDAHAHDIQPVATDEWIQSWTPTVAACSISTTS